MSRRSGCLLSLFGQGGDGADESRLPYLAYESILTQAELSFYHVLAQALDVMGLSAVICPKVRLADIFRTETQEYSEHVTYQNKIDRKHVDFLLCDADTFKPVAGVELDDKSHQSQRGMDRDAIVEKIYGCAGLPLLRFHVQRTYDIPDMVRYMRRELGLSEQVPIHHPPVRAEEPEPAIMDDIDRILNQSDRETAAAGLPACGETRSALPEEARTIAPAGIVPPRCPRCGAPMVLRAAHRGKRQGERFWGCSEFPRCTETLASE